MRETTTASRALANNPEEKDPLNLNLPEISSMDYHKGYLFVPTDLSSEVGDLAVLRREIDGDN